MTTIDRRRALQPGAGALMAGLGPARAAAPAGRGPDLSGVTLRAARYTGGDVSRMMAAAGVLDTPHRLEFSTFASGNPIVEALNAGALATGGVSEIPPVFAAVSGTAVKVVAILEEDTDWQVVLVPKGSPARSIADLRGKRVGYVRATTTHHDLARMPQEAGLPFADVEGVALTPGDGQAAFDRGALDGFAIHGYNVPFALADGARVLERSTGYLPGNYPVSDLQLADHEGDTLIGDRPIDQAGFVIHSAIPAARPDVLAAAHTPSTDGKAWSTLGRPLDPLTRDSCAFYGDHAVFEPFSGVVLEAEGDVRLAETLGDKTALILQNHGLLTVGPTVEAAAWWFIAMDNAAHAQLLAEAAGTPKPIAHEIAAHTARQVGTHRGGSFSFQPLWDSIATTDPDLFD